MEEKKELAELIKKFREKSKSFGDPKFKINNTEFSIVKLPPMAGLKVVEQIRVNLAMSANSFSVENGSKEESAALFFKAILGLPTEFIEYLRSELFEHIQFQGNGVEKGWAQLKGLEDSAFEGFEVINIYEVLARAFWVNFSGSFSVITSSFPGVESLLKLHLPKT